MGPKTFCLSVSSASGPTRRGPCQCRPPDCTHRRYACQRRSQIKHPEQSDDSRTIRPTCVQRTTCHPSTCSTRLVLAPPGVRPMDHAPEGLAVIGCGLRPGSHRQMCLLAVTESSRRTVAVGRGRDRPRTPCLDWLGTQESRASPPIFRDGALSADFGNLDGL